MIHAIELNSIFQMALLAKPWGWATPLPMLPSSLLVSLKDLEFPSLSGSNLIADAGGPISISFANPVLLFDGYFTYSSGITLTALDAAGNEVAQTISTFMNNEGLSGDPHSSPNEYLYLSSPGAI